MHSPNQVTGWRNNWFVRNILTELPIIGGFFAANHVSDMLFVAGKSAAMIAGGSFGMMFNAIAEIKETDDMNTAMAKMTANMTVGSTVAVMAYNSAVDLTSASYKFCKNTFFSNNISAEHQELEEVQTSSENEEDFEGTIGLNQVI